MNVNFYRSPNTGVSMCKSSYENVDYEFVLFHQLCPTCFARLTTIVCEVED